MKIKDVNLILKDSTTQNIECNFKLMRKKAQAPEWFRQWYENEYQKTQPQWFKSWCDEKFDPLVERINNLIKVNNLKE